MIIKFIKIKAFFINLLTKCVYEFKGEGNMNKLEELIIYIAKKSESDAAFGATKLNKILFVADFNHYGLYGKPISDEVYVHRSQGPTPKIMKTALTKLTQEGRIRVAHVEYHGYLQKRVVPLAAPNMSLFSQSEISFVDHIIEQCRDFNGSYMSKWTHELLPWLITKLEQEIPYEAVFVLENLPIDKDGINWAKGELSRLRREESYAY